MRVAHFAFNLSAWDQSGNRVNNNNIDCITAYQRVYDLQRLLTGIWLRNEQIVGINATMSGVDGIECMFHIDECSIATGPLHISDDMLTECCLTRRLRTIDLGDTSTGYAT